MSVKICGVCPHPPIMVQEVGKGDTEKVKASALAMLELGKRIKESGAGVLVMITPHGPVFRDGITINLSPRLKGNLGRFNAPGVTFDLENDLGLAEEIQRKAEEFKIPFLPLDTEAAGEYNVSLDLDHGLTVPLYFLRRAGVELPMVVLYMGLLPREQLYSFGAAVAGAVKSLGREAAVLASGDMSHCLTAEAPGGYQPRGAEFDREISRLLGAGDIQGLLDLDPELTEKAGECGMRPVIMMLGTLDGLEVQAQVLSYEGPFGVGYLVASLMPGRAAEERNFLNIIRERQQHKIQKKKEGEGYLPGLARRALEHYLEGREFSPDIKEVPPEFLKRAGVFVSLKKHGELRGCIGTVFPTQENIIAEIAANAISAGVRDPRFYPVGPGEVEELDISVDVLQSPEPARGPEDLDIKKYGVIVSAGPRQGLLLPNLEGIATVEEQVAIARQKAGIDPKEPVKLQRFEVIRYK